jgi:pre-60S factor REI1
MTATATALTATTATKFHDVPPPPTSDARRSWACNSCNLSFDSGEMQRSHMKNPWQYVSEHISIAAYLCTSSVYNLKRRIACLPPIPFEVFENKIQMQVEAPQAAPEHRSSEAIDEESISPNQCLFCNVRFDNSDTDGVDEVIEYMFAVHGLFIPDQDRLSDTASFLGYLATQIRVWHECLYCGIIRTSKSAVQSHMRDSGHCMLNFEKEPELCGFWECKSYQGNGFTDTGTNLQSRLLEGPQLKLASGKTVTSKSCCRSRTQATGATNLQVVLPADAKSSQPPEPPKIRTCRQLARRDEMGLQNMGFQQRKVLVAAVKRSQKEEATAMRAKEWTYARKCNDQKHDQSYGALAWAKGGMHNLLPR